MLNTHTTDAVEMQSGQAPMFDLYVKVGGRGGELYCSARMTAESCKGQAIDRTMALANQMIEQMSYLSK